ncbi:MAG: hypothetical protein WBF90_28830 [Rivularia sp. (in: cyanobacteria)]|jgi:hypothetical protein
MRHCYSYQGLDINCLLDELNNLHPIDFTENDGELYVRCLVDELVNLHPVNLAEEKSGLDINRLLNTLEKIKRDCELKPDCKLTRFEKRYLCLSLRGYSGREIAFIYDRNRIPTPYELIQDKEKLDARIRNLQKEAAKGLNKYLKLLLGLDESANKPRTDELIKFLKEKGYGIKDDSKKETVSTLFIKGEITAQEITEILKESKPHLKLEVQDFLPNQ